MSIRTAVPDDIPRLIEIRTAVRENRLSNPRSIGPAEYKSFMAHSAIWVWEDSDAIAGFSAGDTTNGWIWALFVDPRCEGRGIGQALLERACDALRRAGHATISLSTAPGTRAERFYLQNGWTAKGRTSSGEVRFEKAWVLDRVVPRP